jgi:AraC-like DNA-binding protein
MVEIFDNIKKIYQFCAPCVELANFIEFFSESSFEETARHTGNDRFSVKMFPSWTPTFWINLGTPYQLVIGKDCYTIRPEDDILLLRDSIVERHNLPSDYLFSVKFFPGGLEAIFGISQTKFINKVVPLTAILPPSLLQRIKSPASFQHRMTLLQDFLLARYARQKQRDHYLHLVKDSIDLYEAGNMQYNTSQIAEKMFVTSKTINRYFNNVVGLSPKKYFSILRARTALTAYVAAKEASSLLGHSNASPPGNGDAFEPVDYGYCDMSHFYRATAQFTGRE